MIHGVTVKIAGTDYTVPPLSLRGLIKYEQVLKNFAQYGTLTTAVAIIGDALRRNYPEITDESLCDLLDVSSLQGVFAAVLRASGLGESAVQNTAPGEGQPQSPDQQSIGAI